MKKIIIILFIFLLVTGCTTTYSWGWYVLNPKLENGYTNIIFLISGLYITLSISLLSIIISLIIGLLISLIGFSKYKIFQLLNRFYIELFRSIPLLVLLL